MNLDPPTLLVALLMGFLLLALELGFAGRALLRQVELGIWATGTWLLLGGFVLFGIRPLLPPALAVFSANALVLCGLATYTRALYRFLLDAPLPRWGWGLLGAGLLAVLLMLNWPLGLRSSAVSLVYVALLLPSIAVIARHGWHAEASLRTVAFTLGLACVALALRAVHAWFYPEQYTRILQMSLGQGLTFLVSFLAVLGAGFGFVLSSFQRVAQKMEQLATHDGLTGCVNRSSFETLLEHALQRARRDATPLALVLLDVDHFKAVNDSHGHRIGDLVLAGVTTAVRSRLRRSDVFGRVGGEEFALLLPDTDPAGAVRLAEQVRAVVALTRMQLPGGGELQVTVSGGIAVVAAGATDAERLYAAADQQLYRAKRLGRDRIEGPVALPDAALRDEPQPAAAVGLQQPG